MNSITYTFIKYLKKSIKKHNGINDNSQQIFPENLRQLFLYQDVIYIPSLINFPENSALAAC